MPWGIVPISCCTLLVHVEPHPAKCHWSVSIHWSLIGLVKWWESALTTTSIRHTTANSGGHFPLSLLVPPLFAIQTPSRHFLFSPQCVLSRIHQPTDWQTRSQSQTPLEEAFTASSRPLPRTTTLCFLDALGTSLTSGCRGRHCMWWASLAAESGNTHYSLLQQRN